MPGSASRASHCDLTFARAQIQLHRIGGVDWSHVNGADALMSFMPDPTWDPPTLEANIKAHQQSFAEKPCTFFARIQLDYEMQR